MKTLISFVLCVGAMTGCGHQDSDSDSVSSGISEAGDDTAGRTSGHCKLDGDCDGGLEPVCLRDSTLPQGYCTSECVLTEDCDGESVCVYFEDEDRSGICMRTCRGEDDCESDQICTAVIGASVCGLD
jgi:hypothetical protein